MRIIGRINADQAAFAVPGTPDSYQQVGLTKREYFAAAALQIMLSDNSYSIEDAARDAVKAADALLAELDK